jgi:hypothetical protein
LAVDKAIDSVCPSLFQWLIEANKLMTVHALYALLLSNSISTYADYMVARTYLEELIEEHPLMDINKSEAIINEITPVFKANAGGTRVGPDK